jgi:acetyl esterase/lipase
MLHRMLKLALFLVLAAAAPAQLTPQSTWAVQSQNHYAIRPNLVYSTQSGYETKLDVYQRRDTTGPQPTVMFIHGGGWVQGTKEASVMSIVPWLEMGWNVVNVEYRLSHVALAPAAVEDCLCALRWMAAHAKDYNFDLTHLVITGESAGGHLAMTTGMIPSSAGFDRQCPGASFTNGGGPDLPKPAAIVNWYGIADLNDMLEGPNKRAYAIEWFGSLPNRDDLAKRLSPLSYVRRDLPPILTVHGDADPIVPYTNATRLRDALTTAGVPNQLHTVPGGGHGNFKPDDRVKIYITIHEFLAKYHVM